MTKLKINKKRTWTKAEEDYLYDNINTIPFEELCNNLKRGSRAVNLHLHQKQRGRSAHICEDRNILLKALNMRFVNYRWFRPTRDFYNLISMTQKRFQAILKGQCKITNDELLKLNAVLCLSNDELIECRQLSLFPE
ncbi:MAG: hypothetical protein LBN27_12235 [Prevotellaceae bacterium]|jgi:predicted RNA-binding protein YlxR (DUF448 family)|nr:hypothetical protein [Prevotellaceae bacterium]